MSNEPFQGSAGPSTDRFNDPVVDPTKNVLDLVTAAIQRQDDLRAAEAARWTNELKALDRLMHAKFTVVDARLESIDREFAIVENRRVEQKIDTKVAVDAALSAAEKAVKEQTLASEKAILKSETSAAEQSKQQNATFSAALKGVTDLLADVKDRVVKVESRKEGGADLSRTAVALYAALHK
jgi:phage-related protein